VSNCDSCRGNIPNLDQSSQAVASDLVQSLFGALARSGIPDFTGKLEPADVDKPRSFSRARPTRSGRSSAPPTNFRWVL
jgi:quinohemoprotein ethanol dehydrogenase